MRERCWPGGYHPSRLSMEANLHGVRGSDLFYPTAFSWWTDEEHDAMASVIASGRFTMGEQVEAFEEEFAAFHKMKHGIMVNSGSSANLIMVQALLNREDSIYGDHIHGGGPRDAGHYALVPALAWSTTYAPLVQAGFTPLLMDCDGSWCFSETHPPSLSKMMSPIARLAIGVSILGVPAVGMEVLRKQMEEYGGVLLEDNCEALGAQYPGQAYCGTLGLMNSFSFYYSHQISAIEGGMVLTDDDECARLCRILRGHGWTRDVDPPTRFEDEYNFSHFGYNVRPTELHAAVARVQLRRLPLFIQNRRANLKHFHELTRGLPIAHQAAHGLRTSPFGLAFTVRSIELRAELVRKLRLASIDCRLPTGGSFTRHPYGQSWAYQKTPNADLIHDTGLFLGNAPFLIPDKIERAVKVMREVLT